MELLHGIPSHDTFRRVFARLDPTQLEVCFTRWVQSLAAALRNQVVLVDSKAVRRSRDAVRGVTDCDSTWGRPTETVHQPSALWARHALTSSKPEQLWGPEVHIG